MPSGRPQSQHSTTWSWLLRGGGFTLHALLHIFWSGFLSFPSLGVIIIIIIMILFDCVGSACTL